MGLASPEVEASVLDAAEPVYNGDGDGDDNYMEHNIHNNDKHKDNRYIHKYADEVPCILFPSQSCMNKVLTAWL